MAKVVTGKLKGRPGTRDGAAVSHKRVRNRDGRVETLRTLDANSSDFGVELRYVFGRNVAKARRENKRTIGTADIDIPKR